MHVPEDLLYTKDHEWVRIEGNTAVVGITDYAQQELGDVVFVELPEEGRTVDAGDQMAVIESVKAVSDVFSPVAGRVVEVNAELDGSPDLINEDCYGRGWIAKIEMVDAASVGELMTPEKYRDLISA